MRLMYRGIEYDSDATTEQSSASPTSNSSAAVDVNAAPAWSTPRLSIPLVGQIFTQIKQMLRLEQLSKLLSRGIHGFCLGDWGRLDRCFANQLFRFSRWFVQQRF